MAGNERNIKVKIDHVEKIYEGRKGRMVALNGIDLDIMENEFICVVGPSGCGKSTLLNIIAGLLPATSGAVYVDGELLEEDYINEPTYVEEGTEFPLTVPEGSIFVMGDNRNHSSDSRSSDLGTVDTRYVIGKAVFLLFPGADEATGQRDFGRIGPIAGID